MRFALLGSGSRGNALVVEAGRTRILLDCGFGPRETAGRLARLGLAPGDLSGILVTHEHSDHIGSAYRLAARHRLGIWMTHGTRVAAPCPEGVETVITVIDSHQAFRIGDLAIQPFPVPHDAREPVQFAFSDGRFRLGILTDAGCATAHIERVLDGCDALVLECNHDAAMLAAGSYPPPLKRRIAGPWGHLDNEAASQLLAAIETSRLRYVVAAHLSEQNNTPLLARQALARGLGGADDRISVADQTNGLDWRALA